MALDPNEILIDVELRLPSSNVLTEAQLLSIINNQISTVGSADEYYAEVTCKSLRESARINKAKAKGTDAIKSRKIEDILEETIDPKYSTQLWDEYLKDDLPNLCADLGYTGLGAIYTGYIGVFTDGGDASIDDEPFIDVNPTSAGTSTTNNLIYPL